MYSRIEKIEREIERERDNIKNNFMNISFENVNKLIILNYLYDNFRKRTG